MAGSYSSSVDGVLLLLVLLLVVWPFGRVNGRGSESDEVSAVLNNEETRKSSSGSSSASWPEEQQQRVPDNVGYINNSKLQFSFLFPRAAPAPAAQLPSGQKKSRGKRGFFDKEKEKQRMEDDYDKSFRLFWLLGGIAIVLFIFIFVLTLLCFCCPHCNSKGYNAPKTRSEPQDLASRFQSPPHLEDVELMNRIRSASVISSTNYALYPSQHRLSQEQVNAIQNRRSSNLPINLLQAQGGNPAAAILDVNVVHENHAEA